jgi:hypothetical protein
MYHSFSHSADIQQSASGGTVITESNSKLKLGDILCMAQTALAISPLLLLSPRKAMYTSIHKEKLYKACIFVYDLMAVSHISVQFSIALGHKPMVLECVEFSIWSHVMKIVDGEDAEDTIRSLCSTLRQLLRTKEEEVNACADWFNTCMCTWSYRNVEVNIGSLDPAKAIQSQMPSLPSASVSSSTLPSNQLETGMKTVIYWLFMKQLIT